MKRLVLFLLLVSATFANAQRVDKPGEPYDYYLQVMPLGEFNSTKISSVKVIFCGEKAKLLLNEEGKKAKFSGIADVLTFFSKRGWTLDNESLFNKDHIYLLRKKVTSDEQAKEFLDFED